MIQKMPWEQLAKYFAGELTGEEHQKMKSWIKANPAREKRVQRLYKVWKESSNLPHQLNVDEAWRMLLVNMGKLDVEEERMEQIITGKHDVRNSGEFNQLHKIRQNSTRLKRVILTTATIAATILVAILFAYQYEVTLRNQEVTEENSIRELVAQKGERLTYILRDGTKVMLHPNSRLEVPNQFNSDYRELTLEGEAYFEVTHDSQSPFIVNSGNAYTRVLGTKFLIQAWPDPEKGVEVVVSEGKVAFGGRRYSDSVNNDEAIISQYQKGVLLSNGRPIVTDMEDLDWYLGWTEGRLVFDNRSLSEITPRLELWYDVDIKFEDDSLEMKKITGDIDHTQPMNEVLRGIAMSLDMEFEKVNRTITFLLKTNED